MVSLSMIQEDPPSTPSPSKLKSAELPDGARATKRGSSALLQDLRHLFPFLLHFARHPTEGIKAAPRLSWPALITLQMTSAMISGILMALSGRNFIDFVLGLFVFPLTSLAISLVITFFLLNFYAVFRRTHLEFQQLYTLVVLAMLPYYLLHVFSTYLPPIDLIGFAFTCLLLTVGISESFKQNRSMTFGYLATFYAAFVLIWIFSQILNSLEPSIIPKIPKTLDELQRGLDR